MGCCTGRCFLITICVLQMVAILERQVFDFLGYMWIPIIGNFLQIVFVIIGVAGAIQYRPRVVIVYVVWCLLWIGWNIFVICFYLEVGVLKRDSSILNIGTGNRSWWSENGLGCITNESVSENPERNQSLPEVHGCLLEYYYVEIIHAGVQCILALMGFCLACYVIYIFTEEDDSSSNEYITYDNAYMNYGDAQPVHDELEYIKMRYKSPARSSFRDNKTYETLTRSTYSSSTVERGVDGPNYSDDSGDRFYSGRQTQTPYGNRDKKTGSMPWVTTSPTDPPQTDPREYGYDSQDPSYRYDIGQVQGVTVI